jgi:lactate permease
MNIFAAISPLLLVVMLTAALRRPAFIAAWWGVALVVLLMFVMPTFTVGSQRLLSGLGATGLITLQALFVIAPGLYLNELLMAGKVHDRLVEWVSNIPMKATDKAILIVVGLAPTLESLTGFGVSLLVTVPLFMAIATRRTALRQALLGMNIMPWGTLALATVVGAQIAGQKVAALGFGSALISFGVFPTFGAAAAVMVAEPDARSSAIVYGLLFGVILSVSLVVLNWIGIVELAGILAGVITTVACLLVFSKGRAIASPPWAAIAPYVIVLGLVFIIRMLPFLGVPLSAFSIKGGGVTFAPLNSPGIALAVTVLIMSRGKLTASMLKATVLRVYKPVLALGGFTMMAQLMVVSGMIIVIGNILPTSNVYELTALAPLLGMVSGYLTGSNVGGNALMMTMQSTVGSGVGKSLVFAAIQNSSAGHAVFASMPIILLVLAISGGAREGEESDLIRYGLLMTGLVVIMTIAAAMMLAF